MKQTKNYAQDSFSCRFGKEVADSVIAAHPWFVFREHPPKEPAHLG